LHDERQHATAIQFKAYSQNIVVVKGMNVRNKAHGCFLESFELAQVRYAATGTKMLGCEVIFSALDFTRAETIGLPCLRFYKFFLQPKIDQRFQTYASMTG